MLQSSPTEVMGKSWNAQRAVWRGTLCGRADGRITVGVCAREKKAKSKHMEAITSRLNPSKFEVIVFGDSCILDDQVEKWPMCDCVIAFYSDGFPSDKAREYVKLRQPYALNNLEMEDVLHDRRRVYDLLTDLQVPHPDNVYASRDGYGGVDPTSLTIVEADDYIVVNNITIHKPFVEKPVDAENHNVYIYYPMSAGGGSKRLFRKIGDRSSEFYPDVNEIRREGSFIYEAFVETQGTDVKVYTVGPDYGHAEARKSPTLDGKVNRNKEGKEIRYPVILSSEEKEYARKITLAFKQCVCGFDILRVQGRSYVCDVNGWSFVKNSRKYVEDCAMLLAEFIEAAVKPGSKTSVFSTEVPLIKYQAINTASSAPSNNAGSFSTPSLHGGGRFHPEKTLRINTNWNGYGGYRLPPLPHSPDSSVGSSSTPGSRDVGSGMVPMIGSPESTPPRTPPQGEGRSMKRKHPEELRAVIAIIRHGDRTPKQKMKMKISFPQFLGFYNKYSPGPRKEIKVKGKGHLKEFLGITVDLIKTLKTSSSGDSHVWSSPITLANKSVSGASSADGATSDGAPAGVKYKGKAREGQDKAAAADEGRFGEGDTVADDGLQEVDAETYGKLHQIKHVLERWEISGINRKLQLKPRQWCRDGSAGLETPGSSKAYSYSNSGGESSGGELGGGASIAAAGGAGGAGTGKLSAASEAGSEQATQLLLILKWGGELTNLGQRQAIELGNSFRTIMYPDSGGGGLLRLHSTFRHDLKIKTSDEGRVMKTAAAFAKGFLELEGELTPILVSLVSKESSKTSSVMMLDQSGNKDIKKDMERSKEFLHRMMSQDASFTPELIKTVVPTSQASVRRALRSLGNPVAKLRQLRQLVSVLVKQLSRKSASFPLGVTDRVSAADRERDRGIEADEFATSRVAAAEARDRMRKRKKNDDLEQEKEEPCWDSRLPARGETPLLMLDRWRKLHDELYDSVTGTFDVTKIPDVHDNVRYDGLHNAHLDLDGLPELYELAKHLADSIVPQEYGVSKRNKLIIGSKMCSALLDKIKNDLIIARSDSEMDMRYQLDVSNVEDLPINSLGRRVRTRLYFTSESHLHTVLNVLRFPMDGYDCVVTDEAKRMLSRTKELCYLTSFVIRLFENAEKAHKDADRFRVEILFSPGVVKHPLLPGDHLHTAPLVPLHKNLTSAKLEGTLDRAIALAAKERVDDERDPDVDSILERLENIVKQQHRDQQQQREQQEKILKELEKNASGSSNSSNGSQNADNHPPLSPSSSGGNPAMLHNPAFGSQGGGGGGGVDNYGSRNTTHTRRSNTGGGGGSNSRSNSVRRRSSSSSSSVGNGAGVGGGSGFIGDHGYAMDGVYVGRGEGVESGACLSGDDDGAGSTSTVSLNHAAQQRQGHHEQQQSWAMEEREEVNSFTKSNKNSSDRRQAPQDGSSNGAPTDGTGGGSGSIFFRHPVHQNDMSSCATATDTATANASASASASANAAYRDGDDHYLNRDNSSTREEKAVSRQAKGTDNKVVMATSPSSSCSSSISSLFPTAHNQQQQPQKPTMPVLREFSEFLSCGLPRQPQSRVSGSSGGCSAAAAEAGRGPAGNIAIDPHELMSSGIDEMEDDVGIEERSYRWMRQDTQYLDEEDDEEEEDRRNLGNGSEAGVRIRRRYPRDRQGDADDDDDDNDSIDYDDGLEVDCAHHDTRQLSDSRSIRFESEMDMEEENNDGCETEEMDGDEDEDDREEGSTSTSTSREGEEEREGERVRGEGIGTCSVRGANGGSEIDPAAVAAVAAAVGEMGSMRIGGRDGRRSRDRRGGRRRGKVRDVGGDSSASSIVCYWSVTAAVIFVSVAAVTLSRARKHH